MCGCSNRQVLKFYFLLGANYVNIAVGFCSVFKSQWNKKLVLNACLNARTRMKVNYGTLKLPV